MNAGRERRAVGFLGHRSFLRGGMPDRREGKAGRRAVPSNI